ncbi:hypothetical protein FTUN_0024 [Frigoriglobus tundricola]|uniref:Uncharacterized protein n=1 Tax=Frigoriglobus tundricola TaxID=2774151 RepID=A0A6M5YEY1_9BACT|nr:hypothetical protein FTUN_0024 [Frigoriglobus tundricola]
MKGGDVFGPVLTLTKLDADGLYGILLDAVGQVLGPKAANAIPVIANAVSALAAAAGAGDAAGGPAAVLKNLVTGQSTMVDALKELGSTRPP